MSRFFAVRGHRGGFNMQRHCVECGLPFDVKLMPNGGLRKRQKYCSPKCRKRFLGRLTKRDPEKHKAYMKNWHANHKEHDRIYSKKYQLTESFRNLQARYNAKRRKYPIHEETCDCGTVFMAKGVQLRCHDCSIIRSFGFGGIKNGKALSLRHLRRLKYPSLNGFLNPNIYHCSKCDNIIFTRAELSSPIILCEACRLDEKRKYKHDMELFRNIQRKLRRLERDETDHRAHRLAILPEN